MYRRFAFATLLMLVAITASAQFAVSFPPAGRPFDLPVANDGTVFVTRNVEGGGVDLAAINPSGTDRWTFRLQLPLAAIAVNDSVVLFGWTDLGASNPPTLSQTSHLFALSLASGTTLAKTDLSGTFLTLTAYRDGFYAQVLVPTNTPGPRRGTFLSERRLLAFDNSGRVIWDKKLD
jgi:hypothetical protein